MRAISLIILLLVFTTSSYSQIVNIESKRIRDKKEGWLGEAGISFRLLKEVNTIYALDAFAELEWKKDRSLFLFLSDYSLIKAGGEKFDNKGFQHIRYNYKMGPVLRWEAFTQAQFNQVRDIKLRALFGTGPRFKIYDSDKFRLYVASLYMYEYEALESTPTISRTHRISSYLSLTVDIGKLLLSSTTYYQPAITDFKDYRIATQAELEFEIFEELSFITKYRLSYDVFPAPGIPTTSYGLSNGLKLKF